MKPRPPNLPALYVEGVDDISAIAGLLKRHGYDTKQGQQHLYIRAYGSDTELLAAMQDTIKAERSAPCGFVLDIDIDVKHRWQAVAGRLQFDGDPTTEVNDVLPAVCPVDGFIGSVRGYAHPFGVWLMPDCATDGKKLEDLLATLIHQHDPLWPHATRSTAEAARLIDEANRNAGSASRKWERFSDSDEIKARIRTWLSWQREPGASFGAAINNRILSHDSPATRAFLGWLSRLYGFTFAST